MPFSRMHYVLDGAEFGGGQTESKAPLGWRQQPHITKELVCIRIPRSSRGIERQYANRPFNLGRVRRNGQANPPCESGVSEELAESTTVPGGASRRLAVLIASRPSLRRRKIGRPVWGDPAKALRCRVSRSDCHRRTRIGRRPGVSSAPGSAGVRVRCSPATCEQSCRSAESVHCHMDESCWGATGSIDRRACARRRPRRSCTAS